VCLCLLAVHGRYIYILSSQHHGLDWLIARLIIALPIDGVNRRLLNRVGCLYHWVLRLEAVTLRLLLVQPLLVSIEVDCAVPYVPQTNFCEDTCTSHLMLYLTVVFSSRHSLSEFSVMKPVGCRI